MIMTDECIRHQWVKENAYKDWLQFQKLVNEINFKTDSPGVKIIKLFSSSTQLRLKFILLINVKMQT